MIKDKAQPSDPEERVQGPRVQIQDRSLSGQWSSFIGEGESSLLRVFRCGTPLTLLRVVTYDNASLAKRMKLPARCVALAITFFHIASIGQVSRWSEVLQVMGIESAAQPLPNDKGGLGSFMEALFALLIWVLGLKAEGCEAFGSSESRLRQRQVSACFVTALARGLLQFSKVKKWGRKRLRNLCIALTERQGSFEKSLRPYGIGAVQGYGKGLHDHWS
ncbi:hypothetical protein L3X38_018543 [Prunus dulcis]|uniref:Uncharacterized protein n=1 Tax=Prunus dulcis TaxID=3755 RepID=A0AAD4WBT5_PRUDU|nr:hypothetical protein L3X38_018543 [Prunus dulcis]